MGKKISGNWDTDGMGKSRRMPEWSDGQGK